MPEILLHTTKNVTLVGGAAFPGSLLRLALSHAPHLIAADSGADRADSLGHRPEAIIGDMDSINKIETWQNSDVSMYRIAEQETTDFEKCLYSVSAPLILGCGFLGARLDHQLAAMSTLIRHPDKRVALLGEAEVVFHWPRRLALELPVGTAVSFFPLRPVRGVASEGLEWPVAGLDFAPGSRIGTSNRALGRIEAAFDDDGMLALLPLDQLDAVVAGLSTRER